MSFWFGARSPQPQYVQPVDMWGYPVYGYPPRPMPMQQPPPVYSGVAVSYNGTGLYWGLGILGLVAVTTAIAVGTQSSAGVQVGLSKKSKSKRSRRR